MLINLTPQSSLSYFHSPDRACVTTVAFYLILVECPHLALDNNTGTNIRMKLEPYIAATFPLKTQGTLNKVWREESSLHDTYRCPGNTELNMGFAFRGLPQALRSCLMITMRCDNNQRWKRRLIGPTDYIASALNCTRILKLNISLFIILNVTVDCFAYLGLQNQGSVRSQGFCHNTRQLQKRGDVTRSCNINTFQN